MFIANHRFRYSLLYSVLGFFATTLLEPYSKSKKATRWTLGVTSPMGLATLKASRNRLNCLVMGNGKSHGTCHFLQRKGASPMGLALFLVHEWSSYGKWQVPWDLPFSSVSRQAELSSYGEWQVPWDLPLSKRLETG